MFSISIYYVLYSSVVLGKLLLQYTFYTSSREKMPCNDGKEKGGVLAELKINFKMRYASRRKGKLKKAGSGFMGRGKGGGVGASTKSGSDGSRIVK